MFTINCLQGGKHPLTERNLAQKPSHATEFSEGICKQTRELRLDLQNSPDHSAFKRRTSQHALVQPTQKVLWLNKRTSKTEQKAKGGVGQG